MSDHVEALESIDHRVRWLRWARSDLGRHKVQQMGFPAALPVYIRMLERGSAFYMAPKFCELVDSARRGVPDDLAFDTRWMLEPIGFLWLAEPFVAPAIHKISVTPKPLDPTGDTRLPGRIHAIGWECFGPGERMYVFHNGRSDAPYASSVKAAVQFAVFADAPDLGGGFHAWTYFAIEQDQLVGDRIASFERLCEEQDKGSQYLEGREANQEHEIRWIYSALHLMAQRLAIRVHHRPETRGERRRMVPEAPKAIDVVTLRRLEMDRRQDPKGNDVDWNWQWVVNGHWRNQFFPSENRHRRIFIESFVKGPPDKPMKPTSLKIFVAQR